MRLSKKTIVIALGTLLAAAGATYAAPAQRFEDHGNWNPRAGEAYEQRGYALIRRGEYLESIGQVRRGQALEREGRQLVRRGRALENRYGWREGRDFRDWR